MESLSTYPGTIDEWYADLATEVLVEELTKHGYTVTAQELDWSRCSYLKVTEAPSFTLSVNPVSTSRVKIEWQSGLEASGHELEAHVGTTNFVALASEIQEAIERHRLALGLIKMERETAERNLAKAIQQLQGEFGWDGRVQVGGSVDRRNRLGFRVAIEGVTEDEARWILEVLRNEGLIGPDQENKE